MRMYGWVLLGALTTLLTAMAGSEARVQEAQALGPDSFLVAVPIRDTLEIQRELGSAVQAKAQAENDRARAEGLRS